MSSVLFVEQKVKFYKFIINKEQLPFQAVSDKTKKAKIL